MPQPATAKSWPQGARQVAGKGGAAVSTPGDVNGFNAPGGVARKSVLATPPSEPLPATNGWTFWQFKDPKTGNLRDMDSLRQEFLARKK